MQIKTIVVARDKPYMFDQEVNAALEAGFMLKEVYTLDGWVSSSKNILYTLDGRVSSSKNFYPVLVAELERQ